jgi:hypothetical protein
LTAADTTGSFAINLLPIGEALFDDDVKRHEHFIEKSWLDEKYSAIKDEVIASQEEEQAALDEKTMFLQEAFRRAKMAKETDCRGYKRYCEAHPDLKQLMEEVEKTRRVLTRARNSEAVTRKLRLAVRDEHKKRRLEEQFVDDHVQDAIRPQQQKRKPQSNPKQILDSPDGSDGEDNQDAIRPQRPKRKAQANRKQILDSPDGSDGEDISKRRKQK